MGGVRRVALIIRDGWGRNHLPEMAKWDATEQVPTPATDILKKNWPRTEIAASGLDVGLPAGVIGNSEVGHQNIGAGRVINQEIVRIDNSLANGELGNNEVLRRVFAAVKKNNSKLHIMGLCSDGGVHSVMRHAFGLLKIAAEADLKQIYLHAISDGRDTPAKSGLAYVASLERLCEEIGAGEVATVIGRFWIMDRDSRWDRIERAYRCLVGEKAEKATSAAEAIGNYYGAPAAGNQIGDEFIPPTQIVDGNGHFHGAIGDGDGVIFFNFRGDRPREITKAFLAEDFPHFHRPKQLALTYATMCEYERDLCPNVLFPKTKPPVNILGEYLSRRGLRQFRTAETEKYAHVTFFFNSSMEEPFAGEERKLIASPRDVATYDLAPAMSAEPVCDAFIGAMTSGKYDFGLVNFANTDMVGHTGNFSAAKEAVATVDRCIGKILSAADSSGTALVVTADHGNVEQMWDIKNNAPHTQHTTNPVELFIYGKELEDLRLRGGGRLADIAPTVLQIMGLPKPDEMDGRSLIAP
ncbi:MAG: 2,3-bisphosphoglycerate-independent phosphoglycerate mutase [Puniceicoccales bacterium]|jgi:2,3-bisphosphoglycerate-independent phosphoglycerate mutase|nr:2,3-bisphosphoglycerate-independent phosphoglycerate mutase [Puniceicoccales bacterium]